MSFEEKIKLMKEHSKEQRERKKFGKGFFFEQMEKFKKMKKEQENKQEN